MSGSNNRSVERGWLGRAGVEQCVQNKSVASLEARSTDQGSGSGRAEDQKTTLDSVLVRIPV